MANQNSPNIPVAAVVPGEMSKVGASETSNANTPQIIINVPQAAPAGKDSAADILAAVASVLWPLVLLLALVLYKSEITSLVKRIRKGKAFGAEAEFDQSELKVLNEQAVKAREETKSDAFVPDQNTSGKGSSSDVDSIRTLVLQEAVKSPRLGLMLLSAEVDKLARRVAAASGHHGRSTVREQINLWSSQLPAHTHVAYQLFSSVRNKIVHGAPASDDDILSAIDSGLTLLSALSSIKIEHNSVIHPGVDIYSDPIATQIMPGKGVILKTVHDGKETRRIFPSTLTHFEIGMRLTWEWNMQRVWNKAWFRDPETGEIKEAWDSSAEFIGKNLDDV